MLKDLRTDSVSAPAGGSSRWLLFLPGQQHLSGKRTLCCHFCEGCRLAFSQREPCLPACARARGLWGGPEPAVLRALTYVERQILSLARVYVVVKRILNKDWPAPWCFGGSMHADLISFGG